MKTLLTPAQAALYVKTLPERGKSARVGTTNGFIIHDSRGRYWLAK